MLFRTPALLLPFLFGAGRVMLTTLGDNICSQTTLVLASMERKKAGFALSIVHIMERITKEGHCQDQLITTWLMETESLAQLIKHQYCFI